MRWGIATFTLFVLLTTFSGAAKAESITLVCEDDFAPYGYESKSGHAAGLATDIVKAAYAAVDVDVRLKTMPYARCMAHTLDGDELGCYDTNSDEQSLANYIFPEYPLFLGEMVLWARSDYEGEMDVAALARTQEPVGVTHGYNYDGPGTNFDYNNDIVKVVAPTVNQTLLMLANGRFDFAAAEKNVALVAIAQNKKQLEGKVKIIAPVSRPGLYLSFSKSHPDGQKYADLLSVGIWNIIESGQYAQLVAKWNRLMKEGTLP